MEGAVGFHYLIVMKRVMMNMVVMVKLMVIGMPMNDDGVHDCEDAVDEFDVFIGDNVAAYDDDVGDGYDDQFG